jgi:hypothetical protein
MEPTGGNCKYHAILTGVEEQLFNLGSQNENKVQAKKLDEKELAGNRLKALRMNKETDIKKDSENFAVALRKDRREQAMAKRLKPSGPMAVAATFTPEANQIDVSGFTIDDAFAYQHEKNMNLEDFINQVATKMKFKVSSNDSNFAQIPDLSRLVNLIYSHNNVEKLFATVGLRRLLSIENDPPIQPIIDANLIPVFVDQLSHDIPKFSFEAAWCLTNIASGRTEHVHALIEKDVIPNFITLMSSTIPEIVDQAVWGVGNIAGDNIMARDAVINAGAMPKLSQLLINYAPDNSMTRNCTWTLSNLCRGKPRAKLEVLTQAIEPLA